MPVPATDRSFGLLLGGGSTLSPAARRGNPSPKPIGPRSTASLGAPLRDSIRSRSKYRYTGYSVTPKTEK
jgi:hypothetical protein